MYKLASEMESLNSITSKKVAVLIIFAFLDQNIVLILCFIYAINFFVNYVNYANKENRYSPS